MFTTMSDKKKEIFDGMGAAVAGRPQRHRDRAPEVSPQVGFEACFVRSPVGGQLYGRRSVEESFRECRMDALSTRKDRLQSLCRYYLGKLRHLARKRGLGGFLEDTIRANKRKECVATEHEVRMLSRLEVPEVLGKSYRQCVEDGEFDRIDKLGRSGIYSKVSTLLRKEVMK